jgi:hypothetical protein
MFDIFSGVSETVALWLGTVAGLSKAKERMEQIAAEKPGHYFIFCVATSTIVTQMRTLKNPEVMSKTRSAA